MVLRDGSIVFADSWEYIQKRPKTFISVFFNPSEHMEIITALNSTMISKRKMTVKSSVRYTKKRALS